MTRQRRDPGRAGEHALHGEGYCKVRARLAHRGLAIGGKRVLRLMRQHQLLAPRRLGTAERGSCARRPDHHDAAR